MKKIIKISVIILLIIIIFTTFTYAITIEELDGSGAKIGNIKNAGGKLVTVVSVIGSFVSVLTLIALGIKYLLGSVEEKASYKKSLMPYVIGALFVFCASTIAGIIYSFFK